MLINTCYGLYLDKLSNDSHKLESLRNLLEGGYVINYVGYDEIFLKKINEYLGTELGLTFSNKHEPINVGEDYCGKYGIFTNSNDSIEQLCQGTNPMYDFKMEKGDKDFFGEFRGEKLFKFMMGTHTKKGGVGLDLKIELNKKVSHNVADLVDLLLKNYYRDIKPEDSKLEKITKVINLCCILQRLHPFKDGNGRVFIFELVPVLLLQRGLLLHQTLSDPWSMIDTCTPARIAAEFEPLCTDAPDVTESIDLQKYLSTKQKLILACAEGDIESLKSILENNPELDQQTIDLTPWRTLDLTEWSENHNQKEIYEFLANRYQRGHHGCKRSIQ